MRIAIIGAGWYGCHLGSVLRQEGVDVDVYEAGDDVLQLASVNNQSRLHIGYHYPRCSVTRLQTIACFSRFMEAYPSFTEPIVKNIYAISKRNSLIDYRTYCQIMEASGLTFEEVNPADYGLHNVGGAIAVNERRMRFDEARRYFKEALGESLILNHRVDEVRQKGDGYILEGQKYDYVINCTWCAFDTGYVKDNLFFEPTILLYYKETKPFYGALTVMDGPCFSIYPYDDERYTLSHVATTARGHFDTYDAAQALNETLTETEIDRIRFEMEEEVSYEFPDFKNCFRYISPQLCVKTKYDNRCASRDTSVVQHGNLFTVLSGKIDTIFVAEDLILEKLGLVSSKSHSPESRIYVVS